MLLSGRHGIIPTKHIILPPVGNSHVDKNIEMRACRWAKSGFIPQQRQKISWHWQRPLCIFYALRRYFAWRRQWRSARFEKVERDDADAVFAACFGRSLDQILKAIATGMCEEVQSCVSRGNRPLPALNRHIA